MPWDPNWRYCALCGAQDIPRGVDWPWWRNGAPAHALCALQLDRARESARS